MKTKQLVLIAAFAALRPAYGRRASLRSRRATTIPDSS